MYTQVCVDDVEVVKSELTALQELQDLQIQDVVEDYYFAMRVDIILLPDQYVTEIRHLAKQLLTPNLVIENMAIKVVGHTNYWLDSDDDIQGFRLLVEANAGNILLTKDGTGSMLSMAQDTKDSQAKFEIWFHTPDSKRVEEEVHSLAEHAVCNRGEDTYQRMCELWKECPVPPGADKIESLEGIPVMKLSIGT